MATIDLPGPALDLPGPAPPAATAPPALAPAADPRRDAIAVAASDLVPAARVVRPDALEAVRDPVAAVIFGLALYGDDLDPDEVSRRMGCEPTRSRRSGEVVQARPGAEAPSCPIGVWRLEVRGEPPILADDLVELLLGRFPSEPSFWQALHRDFALQLHLSIHTAAWDSGFILSTSALARCAATGASLMMTCHVTDHGNS